jgi:hypothetical protein
VVSRDLTEASVEHPRFAFETFSSAGFFQTKDLRSSFERADRISVVVARS